MSRELDLDGSGQLLDVGSGPGVLAVELAPAFDSVIGLDPDAAMLEHARQHAVMSFAAPHLFGDKLDAFVNELHDLLERSTTNGRFSDWPGDTALIIANKPI